MRFWPTSRSRRSPSITGPASANSPICSRCRARRRDRATLIGWKVAGIPGALVATIAFYLPSALLIFGAARVWGRWRGSLWHGAIERGLAPVAAGLFLSGGIVVLRVSPSGWPVWAAAIVTTAVLLRWPRLHPVPLLLAGAALFGMVAAARGGGA